MRVHAWLDLSSVNGVGPYGDNAGQYLTTHNNDYDILKIVLEASSWEIDNQHPHRITVIAHEFYHAWQCWIRNSGSADWFQNFNIKWIIEGSALLFELLYLSSYYNNDNYFNDILINGLPDTLPLDPSQEESYDTGVAYSYSLLMLLILAKDSSNAYKKILRDYMANDPDDNDWKVKFENMFEITVDTFYSNVTSFINDLSNGNATLESLVPQNMSSIIPDVFSGIEPEPEPEKLKFLCLHGGGETGSSFQNQQGMQDLMQELGDNYEFVFPNASDNGTGENL